MKQALVLTVCALMAAGTASAGVAVFSGLRAEFADDNSSVVWHPDAATAAATDGGDYFIESNGSGNGYHIGFSVPANRHSFYLSTTGAATNAALLQIPDSADYEVVTSFVIPAADPYGEGFAINPAVTVNNSFGTAYPGGANIDLAGTMHEGHKMAPELKFTTGAAGFEIRCWDDGLRDAGYYLVNPAITVEGTPHNLDAGTANLITLPHIVGQTVTVKAVKDNTAGTLSFYLTISNNPDFGSETLLFTVPSLVLGLLNDGSGADIPHYRFKGEVRDFSVVVTGASVPNVNAGAQGVTLPSMSVPFFVDK